MLLWYFDHFSALWQPKWKKCYTHYAYCRDKVRKKERKRIQAKRAMKKCNRTIPGQGREEKRNNIIRSELLRNELKYA